MSRRVLGGLSAIFFVLTIVAANWAIHKWGPVPVGFGLLAPAGVYFAGLAFLLRDSTQQLLGRKMVLAVIVVGAGVSALIDTRFALASGVAFLVSELCDFAVYTPLAKKHLTWGVFTSNLVGAFVDSLLFLWLAFGSLEFLWGQVVGKMWVTVPVVLALAAVRSYRKERFA